MNLAHPLVAAALDEAVVVEEGGRRFGNYLLFEKLGRGASGIVFRAKRIGSNNAVALKQMRDGAHATPEERRTFRRGAELAATLQHEGIVRVWEIDEADDCPFFTMDLLSADLATALELGQPSHAQAARWVQQVALAVHHAHCRQVIHCDLKPANILLDDALGARIADFGAAKRSSRYGQCLESGDGVLGLYIAPEQVTGDARGLTQRADIYSLGVILYELLTGQVPYEQLAFADWIAELVGPKPVRAPGELEPELAPSLELVCLKCLEKEPPRRYESAAQLAHDLGCVLNGSHDWVRAGGSRRES